LLPVHLSASRGPARIGSCRSSLPFLSRLTSVVRDSGARGGFAAAERAPPSAGGPV